MKTNASGGYRTGIQEIELRERLLEGSWYTDLSRELQRQLGVTRYNIVGIPDVSRNALLDTVSDRAVCYSPTPLVTGMDPEMLRLVGDNSGFSLQLRYASLLALVTERYPDIATQFGFDSGALPMPSTLALLLGNVQRYWLACNECGVYISSSDEDLIMARARPSRMRGIGDPEQPGRPVLLGWQRPRLIDGKPRETWDVWDIRNPSAPTYNVYDNVEWSDEGEPQGTDVTSKAVDVTGYPWRWTQDERKDQPYVPVTVYHKGVPERLFDRWSGSELAQGTLTLGVLNSFWVHVCRDVSWPDRNIRGMELSSAKSDDHDKPRAVPNDPAVVKEWEDINPDKPGTHWQWEPGADPELLGKAINTYGQMVKDQSVPVDFTSVGGDPLAYAAEQTKSLVEQLYPICREYDAQVLEQLAATLNRMHGKSFPESGYGILYRTEITTLEEMAASAADALTT